ncbi:MAG: toll/interleukin-1 receptor domain-containing protein [Candidatus Lokiarchaeota archaeon]|nr:toll/interleukin-1 receptor domain-containing protein [Candidatus Lokiarchaeota archaeon]
MSQKRSNKEKLEFLNFSTFLYSLTVLKVKDILHQYNDLMEKNGEKDKKIKGYSKLKKEELINLINSNLSEENKNQIYKEYEGEFAEELMKKGIELISGENKVETIQNAAIIGGGNGYTVWYKGRYGSHKSTLQIDNGTIDRDCDCKIGKPGGLCLHQMAIYLMLISKKLLNAKDLPFNVKKEYYTSIQKRLDLLASQSLFKEDPAIMFEDGYKIYIYEKQNLLILEWTGDFAGKLTKDISKEKDDIETWVVKKVVNLMVRYIKANVKESAPVKLVIDSYDVISKIMNHPKQVKKILKKFALLEDPNLPTNEEELEKYLKNNLKESTTDLDIDPPFSSYMGDDPYLFVSYTHKDKAEVYPILSNLHKNGFKIWYDEGIPLSKDWCNTIAEKLMNCNAFLSFVSSNVNESDNTQDEIHFAINQKKPYLAVYIEKADLIPGLQMRIRRVQGIQKFEMTEENFYDKIIKDLNQMFGSL